VAPAEYESTHCNTIWPGVKQNHFDDALGAG